MGLFVADEPFHCYELGSKPGSNLPPLERVELRLQVALSEPSAVTPPPISVARPFVIDNATDLTIVFLSDLEASEMTLDDEWAGIEQPMTLWDGTVVPAQLRAVSLWVFSNLPELAGQPYRINLGAGALVLLDPDPEIAHLARSLLGMNAILKGGLRLLMDGQTRKYSLWIPD